MSLTPAVSARMTNASFVAALAVVLLHLGLLGGDTTGFSVRLLCRDFGRFAVPFFFLVSGYLLAGHADEPSWQQREIAKRMKSLLVPYLAWSVLFGLYILAGVAIPALMQTGSFAFGAWWEEKALLLFGFDLCEFPLMLPLWYLRTLLLLVLGADLLVRAVRRFGAGLLVVLAAGYLAFAVTVDWRPEMTQTTCGAVLRATLSPEAVFYFTVGLWMRMKGRVPSATHAWPLLVGALLLLLVRQAVGPFLPYPVIIPFALVGVWCAVPERPWPKRVVTMTFPLYLIHWFFVHMLERTFPALGTNVLSFPFAFAAIVAACLAVTWGLRRAFPHCASILFGGR